MPGILALIGVILLILAGFEVGAPRFAPGWLGLASVFLAFFWGPITHLAG